jgi:hypothetical protein
MDGVLIPTFAYLWFIKCHYYESRNIHIWYVILFWTQINIVVNISYSWPFITNLKYHKISISMQKSLKNMFLQNMWTSKCKNDTKKKCYLYINNVSFLRMMSWCEVCIFIFKLNLCNYHDVILHIIMRFICNKHEHSCVSFKNNVSFVWIFKILNMYKYHSY